MKSIFSSATCVVNILLLLTTFSSSLKVSASGRNAHLEENEFGRESDGGGGGGGGEIIGNVKINNSEESSVIISSTEKSHIINETDTLAITTTTPAAGVVPSWIAGASSSPSSSSPSPPPPNTRARATKLLEKPLESQLIPQFHESETKPKQNATDPHHHLHHPVNFTAVSSPSSPQTSVEKRRRLLRRTYIPSAAGGSSPSVKVPTSGVAPPARRQDSSNTEGEGSTVLSPDDLHFNYVVSPIEASLGGFTGLQNLPPLSPVQFIKVLVAITPFVIPLIFIPLLIFTIGLLMLPVTRSNVFVDVGQLRSPTSSYAAASSSMIPSFISSYVVNPLKTLGGGVGSATTLMAMPRSLAYDLGTKLVDTEQCVERISCEIAARYLHPHWEQGNWRSIANPSWISRIMSYLWQKHPTVSRIAKSLLLAASTSGGDELEVMKERSKVDDSYRHLAENGNNVTTARIQGYSGGATRSSSSSSRETCRRYACQPRSLLRKIFSSQSTVSTSSSPGAEGKSS